MTRLWVAGVLIAALVAFATGVVPDEPNFPVAIRIHAPPTAQRGELLRYEVTMTNFTKRPVKLDRARCPTYSQGIPEEDGLTYFLNCRSAGVLRRGHSAVFEMRYRIPPKARLGLQPLQWALSPEGSFIKYETAQLTILP